MKSEYELGVKPNGIYEVYWFVKMPDGKWNKRSRSLKTRDKREAYGLFANFTEAPEVKPAAAINVGEAIDLYIEHHAKPRGQEKTALHKLNFPRQQFHLHSFKGVTDEAMHRYTQKRLQKVQPATVRSEITMLQAVLNWTWRRFYKEKGPFAFDKPQDSASRDLWINEEQEEEIGERLLEAPIDVRLFFKLGIRYGARKTAMLELEFGDQVDWINNRIDFNRPGARTTRKRRPAGPITPDLRSDLQERFQQVGRGKVLNGQKTYWDFTAFMRDIGYGWVTPHVLKHSCITLQCRAGISEATVARVTNTTLATIARNYRHHSDDEIMDALMRRRPANR